MVEDGVSGLNILSSLTPKSLLHNLQVFDEQIGQNSRNIRKKWFQLKLKCCIVINY